MAVKQRADYRKCTTFNLETFDSPGCTEVQSDQSEATEEAAQTQDSDTPEAPAEPVAFDIETITCWDLTTTEDEEQAFAATLLYGYHAGSTGIKD